jgi:hypothetical protein
MSNMMIPSFNKHGVLPIGDYAVTFAELQDSILVKGDGREGWDAAWRTYLVEQAEIMVKQLWQIGIDEIYLDGSFVEAKNHPNDIDGYFHCDYLSVARGDLQRKLNAIDPYKIWTWDPSSRQTYRGYPKKQLPMWHRYRVELYPHFGQLSGIKDKYSNDLEFPAAFRRQRVTDEPKGIIKIVNRGAKSRKHLAANHNQRFSSSKGDL